MEQMQEMMKDPEFQKAMQKELEKNSKNPHK